MSTEPVRTIEPDRLAQGEKVEWKRDFFGYPATEWTLEYRFRGPSTGFNVTATADSTAFDAVLAVGASVTAGKWKWQAWATNITDTSIIRKIDEGIITIVAGFATATTTAIETRTAAKIMLDAIDAALLASGTSTTVEYEISTPAGTHREKKSRTEVLEQRKYWAAIVSRENQAERVRNGGKFMKSINANFFER
jgi:microcompartment protein CcmL/EutN